MTHFKPLLTAVALLLMMTPGCASLESMWKTTPAYPLATKDRPATQIIAMWRPSRGTHEGRPTRGFAGNIMFFTSRDAMPALVKGTVRVYVFDDQGTIEEQGKPIRQYDFPSEVWNTYAQRSKIGPSYNVFIPYPRPGKHEAHCTLSLRLIPDDGGPALFSEDADITLDGTRGENAVLSRTSASVKDKLAKKAQSPMTQSYTISRQTIIPQPIDAVKKGGAYDEDVPATVEEEPADAVNEGLIQQMSFETPAGDGAVQEDLSQFVRSRLAARKASRNAQRAETASKQKHPLKGGVRRISQVSHESAEQYVDEDELTGAEVDDPLTQLLQKKNRSQAGRHPLNDNGDVITVDMSGLRHSTPHAARGTSRPRHSVDRLAGHPLSDLDNDPEVLHEDDHFVLEDDDEESVVPLTE